MSLSAIGASLNTPSLVSATGLAAMALLPLLEKQAAQAPLLSLKLLNLAAYGLNFWAVSIPGRIDSVAAVVAQESKKPAKEQDQELIKEMELLSANRGKTLVAPSGWAFAIWGPIFLGELLLVTVGQALVKEDSAMAGRLVQLTAPYIVAHIHQTLWTAAFRPKYKGNAKWVSVQMLSGTAYALSRVHKTLLGVDKTCIGYYLLFGLPVALHFGWTTAASIVNLNGSVASLYSDNEALLAWAGHISVVLAAAIGVGLTIQRKSPVYAGVIAWALAACSDGMQKRLTSMTSKGGKKNKQTAGKAEPQQGVLFQKSLSLAGSVLNGAVSAAVTVLLLLQPKTVGGGGAAAASVSSPSM